MKNTQAIEILRSSKGRRLLRLLIAAACFISLTWIAFNTSFRSHQLLHDQAQQSAKSLADQLAYNAAYAIQSQDLAALQLLVKNIALDEYVMGGAIYNEHSQLLVKSDGFKADPLINGLASDVPGISKQKDAFVTQVFNHDQTPIGFVSIVYLTNSAMSESHNHFHELGRMVLLMLVFTCIFTWQIGRALKRWEVKRQIRKSEQDEE